MNRPSIHCALALAAACITCAVAKADITFSDTEFVNSNWGFDAVALGAGGTSAGTQVSGGNPGFARQMTNNVNGGGAIYGLSRYGTTTATRYDPTVNGAATTIDFAIDSLWTSGIGAQGQSIALGVKQGSIVYYAGADITGSGSAWVHHAITGLTAADFVALSGSTPLDLSATGAPVRFGFLVGNSSTGGGYTNVVQYDNWSVTVHSVPAPACGAVMALGGVAMPHRRRR